MKERTAQCQNCYWCVHNTWPDKPQLVSYECYLNPPAVIYGGGTVHYERPLVLKDDFCQHFKAREDGE